MACLSPPTWCGVTGCVRKQETGEEEEGGRDDDDIVLKVRKKENIGKCKGKRRVECGEGKRG